MLTRDELREELRRFPTREELRADFATRDELRAELARFPTREELRADFATRDELRVELARFPTRDELHAELARFPTRDELREELTRFATKEEVASGFADLRRYMEILYEDLKGTMRTVLDTLVARMDARDAGVDGRLDDHGRRLTNVEGRVTRLEQQH